MSARLEAEYQGANNAYTLYYANQNAQTGLINAIAQALTAQPTVGVTVNASALVADITAAGASGEPNFNNAISPLSASATPPSNGVTVIVPVYGTTYQVTISSGSGGSGTLAVTATPVDSTDQSGGTTSSGGPSTGDTIQASATMTGVLIQFLGLSNLIGTTSVALPTVGQFNQASANNGAAGALTLFENNLNIGSTAIDYSNLYLVEGYEPPGAYHAYLVSGTIDYATAQQAFSALLQAPAGAFSPPGNGPMQSGQVSNLPILGNVTTYVDANDLTVFNVTNPGHLLAPGIVERSVVQGTDGLFHINTYGEGNGILPSFNDALAGTVFGGTTTILH